MKFLDTNRPFLIIALLTIALLLGCTKEEEVKNTFQADADNETWLVPFEDILYWGDPTDEILSIENPEFVPAAESGLQDNDRVFVFTYNGKINIYPIAVLGHREIVNDRIDDLNFAVTYCPITQSGINWNRKINGQVTEFGVSGLLFRDNLVPYDRNTQSNWSQMMNQCINGKLISTRPEILSLSEYNFEIISAFYPEARVLIDPDNSPGKSISIKKSSGETLLGIAGSDRVLLFRSSDFENGISVYNTTLNSRFLSSKVVVVGSAEDEFMVAWENPDYPQVTFSAVNNSLPVVMEDNLGNQFNILGYAVIGPDTGKQLPATRSYRALEFAWASMFETLIYFGED